MTDLKRRGSAVVSRLANFHPDRFWSYTFMAGGYSAPSGPFDLDAVNATTMQMINRTTMGYWKFFNKTDAGQIVDSRVSFETT